jgi:hypothetical protein
MGYKKLLRKANRANRIIKDVSMIGDFATGNTVKASRRLKNKIKGKIFFKLWKLF